MENKTKNLEILQKFAKLGKILSKIAFIFSIIGICGCLVGLLDVIYGSGDILKLGGVTVYSALAQFNAYNVKSIEAVLMAWLIVCAGEAVVAKFAELYFRGVLTAKTPFTRTGAKQLNRLGIITIVIPIVSVTLAEIVQEVMTGFMNTAADNRIDLDFQNEASVVMGVMFIVGSIVCAHGAELLHI
ncbi:MAG: hypothetical protein MR016_08705 [Agathobacter sp.]|nr:hypothetical protein [Agathobacter sp.]